MNEYLKVESPFPWQERMASLQRMPEVIAIPTGCGKTSVVSIAAFREEYRRIVYVVDRRTVVTQTYEAMRHLEQFGWRVVQLRGGLGGLDDSWAHTPDQKTIIISTVDQVGSRLLYRGYGVGKHSQSILAGLLGVGCLYILDEVHLSEPFRQTLFRLKELGAEIDVCSMSATTSDASAFTLNEEDYNHPVISQRVNAQKKIVCIGGNNLPEPQGHTNAYIFNVVQEAVTAFQDLKKKYGETHEVVLLTGRMRPVDRAAADKIVTERAAAGRSVGAKEKPFILVATQCIEAGADYDFDFMYTQAASLDAITQRLGRLNRRGEYNETAVAWINEPASTCPVYGKKAKETWDYLNEHNGKFFHEVPQKEELYAERKNAPRFDSIYLDALATRSPLITNISPWLHGVQDRPADVQIIWRDLSIENADVLYPNGQEAMAVPFYAAKAWLEGGSVRTFSDLEGAGLISVKKTLPGITLFYTWTDKDKWELGDFVSPGDTVLVDCSAGGVLLEGTWDPLSTAHVSDVLRKANKRVQVQEEGTKYHLPKRRVRLGATAIGVEVPLTDHNQGVGKRAFEFAVNLGLDNAEDFRLAGESHDLGKQDLSFQTKMRNGSSFLAYTRPPIAKSVEKVTVGYRSPTNRHEVTSLALAEKLGMSDLVLHLISSHHGRSRPWFQIKNQKIDLVGGEKIEIDEGLQWRAAERFNRLVEKYGHWRLSFFEAILRLADHRQSQWEAENAGR